MRRPPAKPRATLAGMSWISDTMNSVGLALDIVGVVLLYKFGLPSKAEHPDEPVHFVLAGPSPDERLPREKKWNRYSFWSHCGLILLIVGFVLQLVSNHVDCLATWLAAARQATTVSSKSICIDSTPITVVAD